MRMPFRTGLAAVAAAMTLLVWTSQPAAAQKTSSSDKSLTAEQREQLDITSKNELSAEARDRVSQLDFSAPPKQPARAERRINPFQSQPLQSQQRRTGQQRLNDWKLGEQDQENLAARQQGRVPQQVRASGFGARFQDSAGKDLTVQNVREGSAAATIGLRSGDQIVSVGGRKVLTQDQFDAALRQQFSTNSGNTLAQVPLVVRRGGVQGTLHWNPWAPGMTMAKQGRQNNNRDQNEPPQQLTGDDGNAAFLGVDLDPNYDTAAVIRRVHPGSPAERAGLRRGDSIWMINGQRINSREEVSEVVAGMQPGASVNIQFGRPVAQSAQVELGARRQTQPGRQPNPFAPPAAPQQPDNRGQIDGLDDNGQPESGQPNPDREIQDAPEGSGDNPES